MSTRSYIGIRNADNRIEAIYCHFDGYLEHNGRYLLTFYNSKKSVEELLAKGSISSLSYDVEHCDFYDEPDSNVVFINANEYIDSIKHFDVNYVYLFDVKTNKWYFSSYNYYNLQELDAHVMTFTPKEIEEIKRNEA